MKLFLLLAAAALTLKDLPPAVQKTVQEQTKGAEIKSISKETEDGKTHYEIETMLNGKHRDLSIDTKGALIEVEDEIAIGSEPAIVHAVFAKKATGGRIVTVETVTSGGALVAYEAEYLDKNGRKREVRVKPDGAIVPD
jgi:uncharacterized membrane protein YkoI